MGQYRQLSFAAMGRLQIALLPLALLLVLFNLPSSSSAPQPQPGLGFLSDLWNIEVELWRCQSRENQVFDPSSQTSLCQCPSREESRKKASQVNIAWKDESKRLIIEWSRKTEIIKLKQ